MNYWLMKSEPDVFGIDDLKKNKTEPWDGVRNYQARNFMRDDMRKGDQILFYHSSCNPAGIAGLAVVSRESHPDFTCYDKKSKYYDPKSTKESPRWFMVEVKFKKKFKALIALDDLKKVKKLDTMLVLKKGNRLSIMPVSEKEFSEVLKLTEL
jgi:predicted RNA-binding protein with PUA-like domain